MTQAQKPPDRATPQKEPRYSRKKTIASFPWSEMQQDIFEFLKVGAGHALIEARAGTGKTKTLEGIVASLPSGSKITIVAFNVHIVEELKRRIPASVATISTAHKIGLSLLMRYFSGIGFEPNDRKYQAIAEQQIATLAKPYLDYCRIAQESPTQADRTYPIPPPDVTRDNAEGKAFRRSLSRYLEQLIHYVQVTLTCPNNLEAIAHLIHHYSINFDGEDDCNPDFIQPWIVPLVGTALTEGERSALEEKNIGLDDLIWLPERWDIQSSRRDFVLQDESQDSNRAIAALVRRLCGESGRLISVGDPAQSVFGFSGADPAAWQNLKQIFQPLVLPLSVCYRCPIAHLELAQRLVPDIQPAPNAPQGQITVLPPSKLSEEVRSGDLVLCRLTAPLVATCLKLIGEGVKARVRGRDIGRSLAALTRQACESAAFPRELPIALESYCTPRINLLLENNQEAQAESLRDRWKAIEACFGSFGLECVSLQAFCQKIESLFCEEGDRPPVTLSTIHRAKGDEAPRVFILGSNWLPFAYKNALEWQQEQERNLVYVALTRCKVDRADPESGHLFLVPLPKRGQSFQPEWLLDELGGMTLPEPIAPIKMAVPLEPESPEDVLAIGISELLGLEGDGWRVGDRFIYVGNNPRYQQTFGGREMVLGLTHGVYVAGVDEAGYYTTWLRRSECVRLERKP